MNDPPLFKNGYLTQSNAHVTVDTNGIIEESCCLLVFGSSQRAGLLCREPKTTLGLVGWISKKFASIEVSTSQQVVHKQFYITNQSTHIQFPDSLPGISHSLELFTCFLLFYFSWWFHWKQDQREENKNAQK